MKLNELLNVINYDTKIMIIYYYDPLTIDMCILYHGLIQKLDREEISNVLDKKVIAVEINLMNEIIIKVMKQYNKKEND